MPKIFDPAWLCAYMVTYKRPHICTETFRAVEATTPDFVPIVIQNNADGAPMYDNFNTPGRPLLTRGPRPENSPGHLAYDWNTAIRFAFECMPLVNVTAGWGPSISERIFQDKDGWRLFQPCDWLWCLHDDMVIEPGWIDVVSQAARDGVRWFHAPGGDMSFLLHRSIWETVGPWDERFPGTGWKEWDYYLRVLQMIPRDQVVMEDTHGLGFYINHIGLSRFWRGKSGDGHLFATDREWHAARGDKERDAVFAAHDVFVAKWGVEAMREIERSAYRCYGDPGWVAAQKAAW